MKKKIYLFIIFLVFSAINLFHIETDSIDRHKTVKRTLANQTSKECPNLVKSFFPSTENNSSKSEFKAYGTYNDLNFKEIYFGVAQQNILGKERNNLLENISKFRLNEFLVNESNVTGVLTKKQIDKINDDFLESEYVGEASDTVLPLEFRNTVCYVRALYNHMKLLQAKAPDSSIRKIILEGNIRHESIGYDWAYHIVTAVKSNDQKWYVFDLEFGEVTLLTDWFEKYSEIQNSDLKYSNTFLLSIRPSHQWTLIDPVYNFNVDIDQSIKTHIKGMFKYEKELSQEYDKYIKTIPVSN
jgi:hypothetical protein